MTEITEDRDFKTNINVESQTINYIKNPEKFKEDLQKAKNEIYDIYHAVDSTVNLQGKEDRNISEQVGEVRQAKVIYNLIDSRLQEAENQEDIAKAFEEASEDLGYKVKVIFTDPSNSPQLIGVDENGNTYIKDGTAYVDKKTGIGYILVNTESAANSTKAGVIGTIAEEQSHIIGKKEGRQKVVPDGSEKGLESLGKPTNDYFKKQYSKNDKVIGIKSDGKDYSNVDFGENVGDKTIENPLELYDKKYTTADERKEVELDLTRRSIEVETVAGKMLDNNIGYIAVSQFDAVTSEQFKSNIESLQSQGMTKLIVDLRGNPGGLLDQVVDMLDYILPDGLVLYTEDKYGKREEYYSDGSHELKIPMVVLVNENSASASEVFTATFRDFEWGTVVGKTTFGKGIVQNVLPLGDGTAVKITTQHYYPPSGYDLHKVGIKPDLEVDLNEGAKIGTDSDNQLSAAIDILKNEE